MTLPSRTSIKRKNNIGSSPAKNSLLRLMLTDDENGDHIKVSRCCCIGIVGCCRHVNCSVKAELEADHSFTMQLRTHTNTARATYEEQGLFTKRNRRHK